MLPFLTKPRPSGGVITELRPSDHDKETSGLDMAARDLLEAIEAKDVKRLSAALRAASQILESEDEPSDEPESQE